MNKSLFALALGTFSLGMTEYVMMGILPDVAHDLNVTIPVAGNLISMYAIGVCVGAFSLIFMHKYRPKHILYLLTSIIFAGALIASVTPSYWLLLCARFLEGTPHGAFFGVGSIIAVKLAQEGKGPSAVSLMCAGMTVANLMGVPCATFLSTHFSWRIAFAIAACCGAATLWCIHKWVPNIEALPNHGIKAQFRFLKNLDPWLIILATAFCNAGVFSWYSYISPLLQNVSGFTAYEVSMLMIVGGVGMVLGNLASGKLAEKLSAGKVAFYFQLLAAIGLLAVFFGAEWALLSVVMMFVVCACLFAVSAPQQFLIIKHAPGGEMLGGCCIQAAFNLGNAIGAVSGGVPVTFGLTYNYTALVGVPFCALGAICLFWFHKKYETKTIGL